jgi:phenylalanyl-tRNA synthetase alpha chain
MEDLSLIKKSFFADIAKADNVASFEKVRVAYLGRNGRLTAVLRGLGRMPLEERKRIGPAAQVVRKEMEEALDKAASNQKPAASRDVDFTAPGKKFNRGHLHPLTLAEKKIREIYQSMNFSVVDGTEIESDYFNFEALNFPLHHPAREAQDTFWIKQKNAAAQDAKHRLLLRTQVTATQIHYLMAHTPPFQIVYPGRTFRNESIDAGHEINFYQAEVMVVGKNITLANFKFTVEEFFSRFFAPRKIEFRYRPSYFPFVEPGLEVDIKLNGEWFEILGAGMVHPRVFEYAGYNPRDWRGFAFGMGLDRLTMIKYNIPDIRLFYSGDLRFIKQF